MKNLDKVKGCLIGGAVGDALGYPIEFTHPGGKIIRSRLEGATIVSDDTQMTLFTAVGLLWMATRTCYKGIGPSIDYALNLAYKDWYYTQNDYTRDDDPWRQISWIRNMKELRADRSPGMTCLNALSGEIVGTIERPINNSKGCGGVMRVAPIGLYFDPDEMNIPVSMDWKGDKNDYVFHVIGEYGAKSAAITHGHPLGIIPAYVLTIIINLIMYRNMTIEAATKKAMQLFEIGFNKFDHNETNIFRNVMNKAIEFAHLDMDDYKAISEIGLGFVAEEALAIALYSSIKYQDDFEKALICAVNHDGDSDSTGSLAGNIIGVYTGYNNIPDFFRNDVEFKNLILEISGDLCRNISESAYITDDLEWNAKYVYGINIHDIDSDLNDEMDRLVLSDEVIEEVNNNIVTRENKIKMIQFLKRCDRNLGFTEDKITSEINYLLKKHEGN